MIDKRSWRAMTAYRMIRLWGGVSGAKGDDTLKNQEQAQANFTNTLMGSYKKQFAQQSGILSFLTSKLQPMIDNPKGYDPTALAAMRTQATEGTAQSFSQSQKALQNEEAARGGSQLPSGVNAQLDAENDNQAAALNSSSQLGITQADANLKNQNYWSAVNALSGTAQQYNPTGYASQATSGSDAVGNLGTAYKSTQTSPLLGALGGIAGGVAGVVGKAYGAGG